MTPEALSARLRQGSGEFLGRRRSIIGASLAAMAALGVVTLYQVGLIEHLPDPPLPGFDADKVHGSAEAYALLGLPDGVLGLGSYAVTLALAAREGDQGRTSPAGLRPGQSGKERAGIEPWLALALAAKIAFDVAQAGRLTVNEVTQQKALSAWSLLTAGATCISAALVLPEARAAVRRLAGQE